MTPDPAPPLPFPPIRTSVYTPAELFAGFDPARPASYAETLDFRSYEWFVRTGRSNPVDPDAAMMRGLHDASVTFDVGTLIAGRRVVGIMGGHQMSRSSEQYGTVAELGRRLARLGMLVCTGGGPGAMEAGHLGAALSGADDAALAAAIRTLSAMPVMPPIAGVVAPDGTPDASLVAQAGDWFAPAWTMSRAIAEPVASLSIPTWHYGHEPTTPFATHIAKLFQNSIREDGLLTIARQGIVYTEGSAGTLQEVFEDAQQNFYATAPEYFSPMIFFGREYWTRTLPVRQLMDAMFATAAPHIQREYARLVLVTDDVAEAVAHLDAFTASGSRLDRQRP